MRVRSAGLCLVAVAAVAGCSPGPEPSAGTTSLASASVPASASASASVPASASASPSTVATPTATASTGSATSPATEPVKPPSTTTAAGSSPSTTTSAGPAPAGPAPETGGRSASDVSGQDAGFLSPSGNVACLLADEPPQPATVRCEISQHTWKAPPQPSSCHLDWGSYFVLYNTAGFACVGDTVRGARPFNPASPPVWYQPGVDTLVAVNGGQGIGLGYGRTLVAGPLRCSSSAQGISCSNMRTGASLFLSRDRYTLH